MSVDLSVVVAVYNEDPRNLYLMIERLDKTIKPLKLFYEVVFVNDGGHRVETAQALYKIANEYDYVKLVVLSRNFGQQAAITAGLAHAEGDAIVNIDSDCQDPPELIGEMVRYWREGYDVVYAQRVARGDRFLKRFSAFLFYRLLGAISSVRIPWDTGDYRLMDRKVVEALNQMPEKTRFLRGQVPWLGFKQIGIPIERGAREIGESTYTLRKLIQLAIEGLLAFSVAPLYAVSMVGTALLVAGIIGACVWLGLLFSTNGADSNLLLLSAFALLAGVQLICLGIVAIYLSKILDEVRARPTYLVSERVGLPFARERRVSSGTRSTPALESQRVAVKTQG